MGAMRSSELRTLSSGTLSTVNVHYSGPRGSLLCIVPMTKHLSWSHSIGPFKKRTWRPYIACIKTEHERTLALIKKWIAATFTSAPMQQQTTNRPYLSFALCHARVTTQPSLETGITSRLLNQPWDKVDIDAIGTLVVELSGLKQVLALPTSKPST